jgi:hypothetical protein
MSTQSVAIRRALFVVMAAALCVAAAVAIVVVLSGESSYTAERLAWTSVALLLLLLGLAAAGGISALNEPGWERIGWVCQIVALAGFAVTAITIWTTPEYADAETGLLRAAGILFVLSFALAHLALLARHRTGDPRLVRALVLATRPAVVVLAAVLAVAILDEINDDTYYRWVGAVAILWALGTALVPIARRLGRTA